MSEQATPRRRGTDTTPTIPVRLLAYLIDNDCMVDGNAPQDRADQRARRALTEAVQEPRLPAKLPALRDDDEARRALALYLDMLANMVHDRGMPPTAGEVGMGWKDVKAAAARLHHFRTA
jgi:hypothetical protein